MKKVFILGSREKYQNYAQAVENSGASAVFGTLANTPLSCDALLLAGGADINPHIYGEENTASEDIDDTRDQAELQLIHMFLAADKPIMGICRGIQVLNAALGGSLVQHVPHADRHSRCGAADDKIHLVRCMSGGFLSDLYGSAYHVNSAHHQAIKTVAEDLEILACSEDGLIEAVRHKEKPVFAVQWHPERMAFLNKRADTVNGEPLFRYFLSLIQ